MAHLPPPAVRSYRARLGGIARALRLWTAPGALPSLRAIRAGRVGALALVQILRRAGMSDRYAIELRAARIALATRDAHLPGDAWRCGARTRSGSPCDAWPVGGRRRCRMHGGASTGPKTAEGRARALVNLRRGTR